MNNENIFEYKGYTFEKIKANIKQRPYKVRCLETSDTKDSSFSYEDAADMLVDGYNFRL